MQKDKVKHIIAGFLLSWVGLIVVANGILAGVISGFFFGTAKELADRYGVPSRRPTGFDSMDLLATVLGGLLGGVLLYLTGLDEYLRTSDTLF